MGPINGLSMRNQILLDAANASGNTASTDVNTWTYS